MKKLVLGAVAAATVAVPLAVAPAIAGATGGGSTPPANSITISSYADYGLDRQQPRHRPARSAAPAGPGSSRSRSTSTTRRRRTRSGHTASARRPRSSATGRPGTSPPPSSAPSTTAAGRRRRRRCSTGGTRAPRSGSRSSRTDRRTRREARPTGRAFAVSALSRRSCPGCSSAPARTRCVATCRPSARPFQSPLLKWMPPIRRESAGVLAGLRPGREREDDVRAPGCWSRSSASSSGSSRSRRRCRRRSSRPGPPCRRR